MEFKLIIKKLNNTLTGDEITIFNEWFNESQIHKNYFARVKENHENEVKFVDKEKAWFEIQRKIKQKNKTKFYWKFAAAASIALLISISFIYLKNNDNLENNNSVVISKSIEPGNDKAILTLENGADISLEKGKKYSSTNLESNGEKLIYNTKENYSSKEVKYNYLTIPRGGQFFVELSDGTKVWLNSDSKLKYPVRFIKGKSREIALIYGEAYFDVSPSTAHKGASFKVHTQMQQIEVLGTEFNLKAYKEEVEITTTLVEGKVAIGLGDGIPKEYLKPQEQSRYNTETKKMNIAVVDIHNEISWRKGLFSFKNKPLKEIMVVLERWYDVEVIFKNKETEDITFNGVLNKKQRIEEILALIKNSNNIDYKILDKKIVIQ